MEDISAVNATPAVNVEPQPTNVNPAESVSGGAATPQQGQNTNQQTPEENAIYAEIRRKAEQSARDNTIAELGMEWNNQPIKTYAQYQQALREQQAMQEAQQQNVDPKLYMELRTMKDELESLRQDKISQSQEIQLENDPKLGSLYKQWEPEVHDMANRYHCDYETAFTLLTREKLADILAQTTTQGQQAAIKNLQQNAATSPGAAGTGGEIKTNIQNMPKKDFDSLVEKVKRGEINSL